jgi:hypothetical protein
MIDATTGLLTINPDSVLDPTGATGLFQHNTTPAAWEMEQPSAEWRSFERKPIYDAAGRKLALRVYRHRHRLAQVDLFYYLPGEPEQGSWDDWSYEAEMRRKDLHDLILREELGDPPYEYPWGRVGSAYDSKGGFSLIFVRYDAS